MPFLTVRPSSLPRVTTDLSGFFGDTSGAPAPTFYGTGDWSDDSDSTGVLLSKPSGDARSAVLAVDFAPIPGLIESTSFTQFGMSMRVTYHTSGDAQLFPMGVFSPSGELISSLLRPFEVDHSTDAPTTYESLPTDYTFFGDNSILRSLGFIFAFGLDWSAQSDASADLGVFEVAFTFPAASTGRVPPLRLHPRSDGRGMSSAARVWPRPPTGNYGRVGPGSLV